MDYIFACHLSTNYLNTSVSYMIYSNSHLNCELSQHHTFTQHFICLPPVFNQFLPSNKHHIQVLQAMLLSYHLQTINLPKVTYLKIQVFWDMMACRVVNFYWCCGRACRLNVQGSPKKTNCKCSISAGLITNYTLIQETVLVGMSMSFMGHGAREWEWERRLTISFPPFFWIPWHFQAFPLTVFLFLDPGGFVHVPPVLILKYYAFCPHSLFLCFVQFTEQTVIISLYRNNKVVFIREMECFYCAVQNKSLNNSD